MNANTHLRIVVIALMAVSTMSPVLAEADGGLPDDVVFTGWLRVEDRDVDDLILVVEMAESCHYAEVLPNGRFIAIVPVGSQARLTFAKPGYLTKEVDLDTRHSMPSRKAARANRTVKFDVVLEPKESRLGRKYNGPVGTLGVHKGTGSTRVRHTMNVVADLP